MNRIAIIRRTTSCLLNLFHIEKLFLIERKWAHLSWLGTVSKASSSFCCRGTCTSFCLLSLSRKNFNLFLRQKLNKNWSKKISAEISMVPLTLCQSSQGWLPTVRGEQKKWFRIDEALITRRFIIDSSMVVKITEIMCCISAVIWRSNKPFL